MARKLYIDTNARDIANPFVYAPDARDSVKLGQLTVGDTLNLELVFCDENGIASWSGATGYTVEAAIGLPNSRPNQGTFLLQFGTEITAPIPAMATAAQVKAALEALSNVGAGNLSVDGPAGGPWQVMGIGALMGVNIAQITGNADGLLPMSAVTVVTIRDGSGGRLNELQSIRVACVPAAYTNSFTTTSAPGFALALATNTTGIYDLLGDASYVDLVLAFRISGPAIGTRTYVQAPVRLQARLIDESAVVQSPLGAGTLITLDQATSMFVPLTDARLSNARTPTAHAASHAAGGSDAIAVAASQISDASTAGKALLTAADAAAQKTALGLAASDVGLGSVTNDAQLKASQLDTDATLAADSDAKVASQKATKAYVDAEKTRAEAAEASLSTALAAKANTSALAAVATSGAYSDLSGKPTIPSAATDISVDTTGFTRNLASTDNTVQKALAKLDQLVASGGSGGGSGGSYVPPGVTVLTPASGAAALPDASVVDCTLASNVTFSGPSALSQVSTIVLRQDSTGNRIATWPSTWYWPAGTPVPLSTGSGAADILTLVPTADGKILASLAKGFASASLLILTSGTYSFQITRTYDTAHNPIDIKTHGWADYAATTVYLMRDDGALVASNAYTRYPWVADPAVIFAAQDLTGYYDSRGADTLFLIRTGSMSGPASATFKLANVAT